MHGIRRLSHFLLSCRRLRTKQKLKDAIKTIDRFACMEFWGHRNDGLRRFLPLAVFHIIFVLFLVSEY